MPISKTAPNGTIIDFPDGTSEADINAYLKLPEYQQNNVPNKTYERGVMSDVPLQVAGGVRDGVQSILGFVEGLGDTLGELTNIGGVAIGSQASNGVIEYKSYNELVRDKNSNPLFGQFGKQDVAKLPEVDNADTIVGGLTRGISQFVTGWITGGRILKGAGSFLPTNTAINVAKIASANPIKASLGKGLVADTIAFDENSGRFSDMINQFAPALSNPLTDYLASDPKDTFWEGRFKNAVEGLALGGITEGLFRVARYIKNKRLEINNEKFDKELLKQDEQYLKDNNLEKPAPVQNEVKLQEQGVIDTPIKPTKINQQELVKDIEDKVYNNFKNLQETTGTSKEFNQKLNVNEALDLGISTKQFKVLNKEGLWTLDVISKANAKALEKLNKVRTDAIVRNLAERKYGGNISKVYDDFGKLADNLDHADSLIYAHEIMHQTALNLIPKLARDFQNGLNGVTKADVELALGLVEGSWFNQIRVQKGLGRATRQLGVVKDEVGMFNNIEDKVKNITNTWRTFGGDFNKTINQLAQADDARATEKVIAWATKNKTWNVLNEVWINALLSNPKTHIINTTSNLVNTVLKPLETYVGSFIRLENAQDFAKIRAEGQNALSTLAGLTKYLEDVISYTKLSFKNADGIIDGGGTTKLDTPLRAVQGTTGQVVRTPTRFLNAEDEFFKQINYRARMYSIAVQKAIAEGADKTKIVGTDIKTKKPITEFEAKVAEEFRKGFDETGTIGINPDALRYARESTYTQELFGVFAKVQQMTNDHPILKQIIPFVKTPINLMMAVVDRTPLGLMRKEFRDDFFGRSQNLYRTAQVRGQLATGFAMITYANYLASTGAITGSSSLPSDNPVKSKNLKDLNRNLGFQPYSFRVFNEEKGAYEYIPYGRFDPFGAFFGLVADFHAYHHKLTEEDLAKVGNSMLLTLARQGQDVSGNLGTMTKVGNYMSAGWSSLTRNLFSKTYLKGLTDTLETLVDDDPNKLQRVINSKFGSFIPSIFTKLVNDPFYRDARDTLDEVMKRTGTGNVQIQYDFRGNPLMQQGNDTERLINNVLNPFASTTEVNDPVAKEIIRLGLNTSPISQNFNGAIDLTKFKNKQGLNGYDRLNQILQNTKIGNSTLDQALRNLITSDVYKNNLSDPTFVDENVKSEGGRSREIKKLVKTYHKMAEVNLLNEMNDFVSTLDKSGKFTLQNSNIRAVQNKTKIGMGIQINQKDIDELYKFSQ